MASTITGYYTVKEAADVLGVDESTVRRYCADKLIEGISLGKQWLIEQSVVHNFKKPNRGNPNFRRAI